MMRYQRVSGVQASAVGDRAVLYHPHTKRAIVLNPTGARLWQALAAPRTANDLTAELTASCPGLRGTGVTPEQVSRDVAAYLQQLSEQQLVTAAD